MWGSDVKLENNILETMSEMVLNQFVEMGKWVNLITILDDELNYVVMDSAEKLLYICNELLLVLIFGEFVYI